MILDYSYLVAEASFYAGLPTPELRVQAACLPVKSLPVQARKGDA